MNHLNNENDQVNAVAPAIDEFLDDDDNEDDDEDAEDGDDVFDPAEGERICQEAMTFLQNRLDLPSRLRDQTMVRFARQFINNVKEDIYQTITDTRLVEEGYDGLDSARDTEEEVETAIRSCREVLTRQNARFGLYPIKCLTFMQSNDNTQIVSNVRAVSFVPLFARLAMEFNSFPDEERGGLLIEDNGGHNVLHDLVGCSRSDDEDHHQLVDTTFVAVLIRLRRSGCLMREDIKQYELVHKLCKEHYFLDQRFRFLTGWCPSSLLQTDENGYLPFHWGIHTIRKFRVVLEAYFQYYPKWNGLHALFSIANHGCTPFQLACDKLTHTEVMEVVEDSLVRFTTNESVDNNNALILAATDDTISLDGVYFIIRRQPDTMLSMLRHREEEKEESTPTVSSMLSSSNNTNNINNRPANRKSIDRVINSTDTNNTNNTNNDDNDSNNNHNNGKLRRSTRKRKHT